MSSTNLTSSTNSFKGNSSTDKDGEPPLQISTTRNLTDRIYDKRKIGALEVGQLIKELNQAKDEDRIRSVIQHLVTNFSDSAQGNSKKGGLIALAATAVGLGSEIYKYTAQLIPPVLKCFIDQDPRVRYYACESLYNIAKVARQHTLLYFNEIFDALCKLFADPDVGVKNAAQLLDRLMKDIITEDDKGLDIERFIPLLQERVYVINAYCRQFLIAWIVVLDSVPDINMLQYLPRFLDGLFNMLKDNSKDIRVEAETCLAEFLREIKRSSNNTNNNNTPIDFGSMMKILLNHCVSKDEFTRHTALDWVNEFILLGKNQLLPFSPQLLAAILPCLSHESQEIKESAIRTNNSLLNLIIATTETESQTLAIGDILKTLSLQFMNPNVPTRLAGLNWLIALNATTPQHLLPLLEEIFQSLISMLSDQSDDVVLLNLEVLGKISSLNESYFSKLMDYLVEAFRKDRQLLDKRAHLIVTQLSLFINPEKIYLSLAKTIQNQEDLSFTAVMVQTLNLILLTSKELADLRNSLKGIANRKDPASLELFTTLYRSWSHNAASTLSLCLLSQFYRHASDLIHQFTELEVTVSFLLDLDKLVQLLESPIFLYLRLQLLQPARYSYLFQTLYGLLMLLPQSGAFETLKNRLNAVSPLGVLHLIPKSEEAIDESKLGINFADLLEHFVKTQHQQADFTAQKKALTTYTRGNLVEMRQLSPKNT